MVSPSPKLGVGDYWEGVKKYSPWSPITIDIIAWFGYNAFGSSWRGNLSKFLHIWIKVERVNRVRASGEKAQGNPRGG